MDKKLLKAASKGDVASLKKLINGGANVVVVDKKGNSPLHLAATTTLEAVKLLVEKGVDPRLKNGKGQTAADLAKKKRTIADFLRHCEAGGGLQSVCKASVAVYQYENEKWEQVEDNLVNLELLNSKHPFAYKLVAKLQNSGKTLIDAPLDINLQYSAATSSFHNFQDSAGIWGFNFVSETEAASMQKEIDNAKSALQNPEAANMEASLATVATPTKKESKSESKSDSKAPQATGGPPPPPMPTGGPTGGPPPPPGGGGGATGGPPMPPTGGPKPTAVGGGGGMSLADQIAAKKLKAAEDRPKADGPVNPLAGGGNMMSELANRLKKRKPTVTSNLEKPIVSSGGVVSTPSVSKEEIESFKSELLEGFRAELSAHKEDLIATLRKEIQDM